MIIVTASPGRDGFQAAIMYKLELEKKACKGNSLFYSLYLQDNILSRTLEKSRFIAN